MFGSPSSPLPSRAAIGARYPPGGSFRVVARELERRDELADVQVRCKSELRLLGRPRTRTGERRRQSRRVGLTPGESRAGRSRQRPIWNPSGRSRSIRPRQVLLPDIRTCSSPRPLLSKLRWIASGPLFRAGTSCFRVPLRPTRPVTARSRMSKRVFRTWPRWASMCSTSAHPAHRPCQPQSANNALSARPGMWAALGHRSAEGGHKEILPELGLGRISGI